MTEQHRLPLQTAVANHWQCGGFLSPAVLNPLYAINRSWLEILASPVFNDPSNNDLATGVGDIELSGLSGRIAIEVAQLDSTLRLAMARCPFALFGAHFHDGGQWARISGLHSIHEPAPQSAHESVAGKHRATLASFAQVVFFYAWHLIHLNPLAARLLLGMSDEVSAIIKELPLTRLHQLANEYPQMITPRWPERALFWQVLLNAAQKGETYLAETRLLGIQMVAADLLPTSGEVQERKR